MRKTVEIQQGWLLALIVVVAGLPGCGQGPARVADVNSETAESSLLTALEAWKAGKRPADLREASPSITVQDLDWESGKSLVSFEIQGQGTAVDANLRVPVKLRLEGEGGPVEREVTYVVGTSPSITVFRELFP